MRCWNCIGIVLLLGACKQGAAPPVFPASVDAWQRKSSESLPAGSAPQLVRKIGTRGWWRTVYQGPGTATVDVYELTAPPGGLEIVQRWRPAADAVVWYTPRYFVLIKWQSADREALGALIRSLEKQFQEQK